jgi:hypothetical protein
MPSNDQLTIFGEVKKLVNRKQVGSMITMESIVKHTSKRNLLSVNKSGELNTSVISSYLGLFAKRGFLTRSKKIRGKYKINKHIPEMYKVTYF